MRPWEKNIRRAEPYVPGEQPKGNQLIKLNTNENPYPPAPGVKKALEEMNYNQFKKYPDPSSSVLIKALSEYYHVGEDGIFVGVGSDDVLAMAFLTFFNSQIPVLFPDMTYSFYNVWAELFQIPYETPALDDSFCIRKEDYYKENGGIIFPNPNAPTGVEMSLSEIEDIIAHNQKSVVIVDEAYIDFGGESALELIKKYENLLVVQTFSKSRSMAGMRIGFAMGHPDLIHALSNVKYSFNSYTMNTPSLILGVEAIKDDRYFEETLDKIIRTRTTAGDKLRELGFTFPDSKTNFLFVTHKTRPAEEIFHALRDKNIFVRHFNKPRLSNHLRISIGTDEEMEKLYQFLKEYL